MRVLVNLLAIAFFSAFLLAPLASLLVFGYDEDAENIVDLSTINPWSLIAPNRAPRDDLIDRALTNSPVGMGAIRTRNRLDYSIFGYVETDQVISGREDWLFYKPSFMDGECTEYRRIQWSIDKAEAFRLVAEASGIKFIFSVSPDKSVVAVDQLGERARISSGCKIADAKAWREYARATGSQIMDHLSTMQDDPNPSSLYFKTDTHWNERGGALAIRQIAMHWLNRDVGVPMVDSGTPVSIETDLLSGMLRLEERETAHTYPVFWQGEYSARIGSGISNSVIIHDSFYKKISEPLRLLFPDGTFFDLNHPNPEELRSAVAARPTHLLVNSVERRLVPRLFNQNYSWNSPFGKGLIDANETAAASCTYRRLEPSKLRMANAVWDADANVLRTTRDPRLYITLDEANRTPCLRVSFKTSSDSYSQLFLPAGPNGGVREGMSIRYYNKLAPERTIQVVLPRQFARSVLRFDPDLGESEIQSLSIEIGSLNETLEASTNP